MRDLTRTFAVVLPAVCGLFYCHLLRCVCQEPLVVDGIAAVVNGDVITISQVRSLSAQGKSSCGRNTPARNWKTIEGNARISAERPDRPELVFRRSKKRSTKFRSFRGSADARDIRENFGGDRNTFIKTLEAQNYTLGDFRQKEMEQ